MTMDYVIGLDIGTTGVKCAAIDRFGNLLFEGLRTHDAINLFPGFAEGDPDIWWDESLELLSEVVATLGKEGVSGIGVSGMVPTLILIDSNGKAIRPSIQMNDCRAVREIEELKDLIDEDEYFQRSGNMINQQVIFPKYLWLQRNEPENLSRAKYIMGSYNYITFKLTGVPGLELNWALESGMWSLQDDQWIPEILDSVGFEDSLLSPVYSPTDIVGRVTGEVSNITGLPKGTPVIAGSADHIASALAAGMNRVGDLLLKFGGGADILVVSDRPVTDKRLFIDYHDVPGMYIVNGCMASSGSVIKWFSEDISGTDYSVLSRMAEKSPPGSKGLITLPYFLGEKTPIFDIRARGTILGLTLSHNKGDIFRSLLESVAFGFRHHLEVMEEMGIVPGRVFMTNGGSRNKLWRSITADVVGHDAVYLEKHTGSSLGAAFLAGIATGVYHSWDQIGSFMQDKVIVKSDPMNHRLYSRYFQIYKDLYRNNRKSFSDLFELENQIS